MKTASYTDLVVWQKSMELVTEVYSLIQKLPNRETFILVSQMARSAISIPSNIAEGYHRQYVKEYTQFLSVALGSCAELQTQLEICKHIYQIISERANGLADEVMKMLYTMIKKRS